MNAQTIEQFKVGNKIEGFFMVRSCQCKVANNQKKFLDITLCDKTGEINAKLWECTDEDEKQYTDHSLVKIRASVSAWQDRMQLKIERIRLATENDQVDPADFVPVAPFPAEYMYKQILHYISRIDNQDIKNIVSTIIEQYKKTLMFFPAAMKNHHAIRSGLLYHIVSMLKTAEKLSEIYTFIDTDLLFAGVILHDIGKLEEMNATTLGMVSDYTCEGNLLGHIIQGIKLIDATATKLKADPEASLLLQHMLLSHHYQPDFGSPKKPMFPEAELLHYIDLVDSRMYDMQKALEGTTKGEFSERIWSLDQRKVYKNKLPQKTLEQKSLA